MASLHYNCLPENMTKLLTIIFWISSKWSRPDTINLAMEIWSVQTTRAMDLEINKEACVKTPQASCSLPIEWNKMAVEDRQILMSTLVVQLEHMV